MSRGEATTESMICLSKCSVVVSETPPNVSAQAGFEIGASPTASSKHIYLWHGFFTLQLCKEGSSCDLLSLANHAEWGSPQGFVSSLGQNPE